MRFSVLAVSNFVSFPQVAFSYSAQNDDELDLEVGEIIYGLREVEDGWWEGHKKAQEDGSSGKLGVFPSNFVKVSI